MPSTRGIQTNRALRLETTLPETPSGIEKNNIESFSERKRKRITAFNGCKSEGGDSTKSNGE